MLELRSFPPAFGEPSISPYCVKAMCLLRMSGVEWQPVWTPDPRKQPKGKLPVLVDNGKTIPDSHFIRLHLESVHGADFDAGLSEEQRAQALALIRMAENHLGWAGVYNRWIIDENWAVMREAAFGFIPKPMRALVSGKLRKDVRRRLHSVGIGEHSEAEIVTLMQEDVAAIAAVLGEKPYLFGDRPSAADAAIAPVLGSLVASPQPTAFSALVTGDMPLMDYAARCREAIYPQIALP